MSRFRPPFVSVPCSRIIHNVSRPSNDRHDSPRDLISSHRHRRRRHERFYRARPSASHTRNDNRLTSTYMHPVCVLFLPPPPSPTPCYITSTTKTSNTFTSAASVVYIGLEAYLDFGTIPHHKVIQINLNYVIQ